MIDVTFKVAKWERVIIPDELADEVKGKIETGEIKKSTDLLEQYPDLTVFMGTKYDGGEQLELIQNDNEPTISIDGKDYSWDNRGLLEKIAIKWSLDDIHGIMCDEKKFLRIEDAQDCLLQIQSHHDPEHGIHWETLRCTVQDVHSYLEKKILDRSDIMVFMSDFAEHLLEKYHKDIDPIWVKDEEADGEEFVFSEGAQEIHDLHYDNIEAMLHEIFEDTCTHHNYNKKATITEKEMNSWFYLFIAEMLSRYEAEHYEGQLDEHFNIHSNARDICDKFFSGDENEKS